MGIKNLFTKFFRSYSTSEYNGKKYDSLEDMPQEIQALLEDKDGNGIPDGFEN
eukprot:COSAG01_NODE_3337_length_6236_cov_2.401499_3_plen_53_part_00